MSENPNERKLKISQIFQRLEAQNPDPRTELVFHDAYSLLIAVVLSAQTTDVAVNKVTGPLFARAGTPDLMVKLGVSGIEPLIKTIGLYRTKAKNLVALSQQLLDRYHGKVPLTRLALEALPGVGRKTASVVLNSLGIEPAVAVDTHVFRLAHRLGLSWAKTPTAVEKELTEIIPKPWLGRAHHWLILHGRYVCTARKPRCETCILEDLCPKNFADG